MAEVGGGQPWEQLKLTWETRRSAPCEMRRGAAVAHGSLAYFSSCYSHQVFGYNPEKDDWSKLPECPQSDFGLAVINNILTAVGGEVRGGRVGWLYTNCLSSFRGGEWVKVFPPMPTKRCRPAVVSAQNYLIAVGGCGVGGTLSTVEVMDMNTLEWYTAASLPEPVQGMSATVCGGRLYLLGGFDKYHNITHAVFTCTLDSLLRSCHPPAQTPRHTSEASLWQRVTDVPVRWSSCTTLNGRVVAVGGGYSYDNVTAAIHVYSADSDLWLGLGNMPTARYDCLVVGLRDRIIAVGGYYIGRCATVEVGYLQLSGLDLESVDGTTVLDEDDLRDMRLAVADLSGRWVDLGVSLGIRQSDLEAIVSDSSHSSNDRLRKVLTLWLRQNYKVERFGKPTWRRLVVAVKDHNLALARTIAREHHVDRVALQTALEKERMMPLCIAQCMTVGAPQTGKSFLKRRLLKQTSRPSMSTDVAEKPVVCAVTVDGNDWTVLEWEEEGAQLLQCVKQLPSKENPETNQLPTPSISIAEDAVEKPKKKISQPVDVNTDNFPRQHASSNSESSNVEVDMKLNEPEPSSYSDLIDTILDVGSEKWIAAKKRLENQCTIYFTDTGGQLEFQEVLPVIISGPSIFLLVFNLEHAAEGLDKEFPAVYKRSDGSVYEPPPGMSTFTVRDLILHVLASIQSTRSYQFQKDGKVQVIEAKVLLVGTHSDRVRDASVRNRIESEVQKLLKDTPYYQKGMLQVPCSKRQNEKFVYMVNNESSEDPAFQEIREKVRSLIFKKSGDSDYKENISSHWLGFDLMLQWPGKPKILKYQHCVDLARRCGIKEDDVDQALTFLHKRFGIIRYFKGKGLGHIVITNPQVIYNMLSNLIAEKFNDDSDFNLTPHQLKEFQDKGLISEDAVKCIASQWSETHELSLQFLLSLLSHLHLVVKLQGDEFDPEIKYFMPCVLTGNIHDLSTPEDISEPIVADLLILFDRGRQYCPKGLLSVFVIKLAEKPKQDNAKYTWVLKRTKLSREGVVFHVKVMDSGYRYSYTVHIQHGLVGSRSMLRIFIEKLYSHLSHEQVCCVCKEIRDSLKSAIKSSWNELHKSTELCIGFYSTCDKNQTSSESHIAIVKDLFTRNSGVPEDMTCIDCRNKSCPLKEEHKVWFEGLDLESVDGTTVLDENDLDDVGSTVADLAGRWRDLGDSLGIRSGHLDAILSSSAHSPSVCLRMVLTLWLRQNYKVERFGKPTWRRLVEAVEDHVGGNNFALAQTIAREHPGQLEPTSNSKHLFNEAMKEGHVRSRNTVTVFIGAAGTGKTCSKHVLMNENPPEVRVSTPMAERPVKVMKILTIDGLKWHRLSPADQKKILATFMVNIPGEASDTEAFPTTIVDEANAMHSSSEAPHGKSFPTQSSEAPHGKSFSAQSSGAPHGKSISSRQTEEIPPSTPKDDPTSVAESAKIEQVDTLPESSTSETEFARLIELLSGTEAPPEVSLVYLTDSGGQPQFHEVLPIFLRRTSVYIFVMKLSESLDKQPLVEYFDENGNVICKSYTAAHTNMQILRHCIRTMQLHKFRKAAGKAPNLVFVGTHKDQEHLCPEAREVKNQKLAEMLLPEFQDEVVYSDLVNRELIFPLNAKSPGEKDQEVAKKIREIIMSVCPAEPDEIPLRWYCLELKLQEIAQALGRGVMRKDECFAVARTLHFDTESFEAALKYLDELNIIFYYPDILPNTVFTDSQVLITKASELVKFSHKLRNKDAGSLGMACGGECRKFQDYALVTVGFLKSKSFELNEHYVDDIFTPDDLVKLFRALLVFADFSDTEYFMPCLLQIISSEEVAKHRVSSSAATVPLVLYFPKGVPPLGIFCSLVVHLLSTSNRLPSQWKLKLDRSKSPVCLHRNCVQFTVPNHPGTITLIDSFDFFQVHVSRLSPQLCSHIREALLTGLERVISNLGYNIKPELAFLCPCSSESLHLASIDANEPYWICSQDSERCGNIDEKQQMWLPTSVVSATTATPPSVHVPRDVATRPLPSPHPPSSTGATGSGTACPGIGDRPEMWQLQRFVGVGGRPVRVVENVCADWEKLALSLQFRGGVIRAVERSQYFQVEAACLTILQRWLDGEGRQPVTWETLVKCLEDIGHSTLASDLRRELVQESLPSPPPPSSTAATGSGTVRHRHQPAQNGGLPHSHSDNPRVASPQQSRSRMCLII